MLKVVCYCASTIILVLRCDRGGPYFLFFVKNEFTLWYHLEVNVKTNPRGCGLWNFELVQDSVQL
jgi:hypothetical protein